MDYPPHSLGAPLPHYHPNVDHSRSRFRGPPPSQPYYLFQWNLHPYNQYGQALSALPFVRPYMAWHPNMSVYPGYVGPQALGCPLDYKLVLNSHISSPVATDFHSCYPRKMGRSEVQRNPRDPLGKMVDHLDRLSMKEKGDGEEKDLPKAPPSGRGTPCFPDMGELKETAQRISNTTQNRGAPPVDNVTCVHQGPWPAINDPQEVNHQEESPLRELGQESWTLKAGPHPAHNQAAVSGIKGFFPLDGSSVYEEETLCLVAAEEPPCHILRFPHEKVDTGCQSVLSSSIYQQSSSEDVSTADISASARNLNLNTNQAMTMDGSLMATQFEGPEADQDVCDCCGASLEENDDRTGNPGEHFHGSPFEVAHAGMACSFVEEFAANKVRDGAEMIGSCLMPGQNVQNHYWYPCACPPNPRTLPPLGPHHPTRRAVGQCPCGELDGCQRTLHDPKGNGGYDRAPHYCPPTCLRSKAKDKKRRKQRGGAQPRNYDDNSWMEHKATKIPDSWGNCCSKYRPWSSRPYKGPDDQGSLQNESFSRNMPWRADYRYKEDQDSHHRRGRGSTKRRGSLH